MDEADKWDAARRNNARKKLLIAAGVVAGVLVVMAALPDVVFSLWNSTLGESTKRTEELWKQAQGDFQFGALRTAVFAGGLLALASLWLEGRIKKPLMVSAVLVVLALDIFPLAGKFIHTHSFEDYYHDERDRHARIDLLDPVHDVRHPDGWRICRQRDGPHAAVS